jgi:hypothetical protein
MLSANGLRPADNGLDNSAPGSCLLTIDDADLQMGQCPQPVITGRSRNRHDRFYKRLIRIKPFRNRLVLRFCR